MHRGPRVRMVGLIVLQNNKRSYLQFIAREGSDQRFKLGFNGTAKQTREKCAIQVFSDIKRWELSSF